MSDFSAVDDAAEPARLVSFLERSAVGLAAMKHYMAAAHARRQPSRPVLDLGCGAGHDLAVLEDRNVACVGVDPSSVMVAAAGSRAASPLVQAAGEGLPFADGVFAGCWIERVLMHVNDPGVVLSEAVRCLQPGGLLTVFEPDWSSLTVNGAAAPTEWVSAARHPAVGAAVGGLLVELGCSVRDRVEERSWWTFSQFERITNLGASLDRVVTRGRATRREVDVWRREQERRDASGVFRAELVKILWVATTRA